MTLLQSERAEGQRHIVLCRDASLVLELDFTPGPSHTVPFDAVEIPFTRSVKYPVAQNDRTLLSLRILLVDAATVIFMRDDEWNQEQEEEWTSASSLVDFQAEKNIFELCDGKAIVRFRIPCRILDSMRRTGRYR